MKILKTRLKTIVFFFIAMTMFQSCIAYRETPVSLLQGEQSKARVKVNTISNQTYRFEQIILEEGQFYGLKKEKGEIVRIAIHNSEHSKVYLYSKSKSTWETIAVIAVSVITLAILKSSFSLGTIDLFGEE
jgi:hypothetical protein